MTPRIRHVLTLRGHYERHTRSFLCSAPPVFSFSQRWKSRGFWKTQQLKRRRPSCDVVVLSYLLTGCLTSTSVPFVVVVVVLYLQARNLPFIIGVIHDAGHAHSISSDRCDTVSCTCFTLFFILPKKENVTVPRGDAPVETLLRVRNFFSVSKSLTCDKRMSFLRINISRKWVSLI